MRLANNLCNSSLRIHSTFVCCSNRRQACTLLITVIGSAAYAGQAKAVQQLLQEQQLMAPNAIEVLCSIRAAAVPATVDPKTAANSSSNRTRESGSRSCKKQLDPALAAAFIAAVYDTAKQQQVIPEQQLQVERYKLQNQEYKYYAAANKERMPALPDLDDSSGGLSNRTFYNFISYVLWKVMANHLPTPEQRTAFCAGVGKALLQQLAPETLDKVSPAAQQLARDSDTRDNNFLSAAAVQQAPASVLVPALHQLLGLLQQRGYICGSQLVWGSQPGSWPADWADSEDAFVGEQELLLQPEAIQPGFVFQVKLLQPADIEGSVALRAEEDGFWSRHVSSMLAALLSAGGYKSAYADEYFYQDYWQGPASVSDKLLLFFGDPLQQVDVPWTPTTLVQNWTVL